ncbi:MAG: hypothetical protein JW806_04230 [Sedimentisphaerales bacterium]|nr:hypothetical protein [Sedimentisphaerales bacterium]
MTKKRPPVTLFVLAVIIYTAFTGWLFWNHLDKITEFHRLSLFAIVLAASGAFLVSGRYVNSFVACFIAGLIYGFGAFASAFLCYHPSAGLVYACLPWTFVPAAFLNKWIRPENTTVDLLSAALSLLPFIFIIACFYLAAMPKYRFVPIPLGTSLSAETLTGLFSPTGIKPDTFSVGFYHAPLGALVVGLILFFRTRRFWITVILAVALFLAFQDPFLNVPPAFWLSLPVLICSITIAEGLEALVLAGRSDASWLLPAAAVLLCQAIFNTVLGKDPDIFLSNILSGFSLISVLFIFFIARAGIAAHYPRMLVLYSAVTIDIIIVTRSVVEMIF